MSNLHLLLDEANKHDPKGFIPAPFNTFSVKNELGVSFYEERMSLPKAINFVDGTLAPPTTVNNDVYVIIGAGVIAAGWGNATFGDWVKFTNSLPGEIVPLAGYLCYDSTAASWMEYDGVVWATFGGGGAADTNLATNDLTLTDPSRFYNVNGNDLQFKSGINNRVRLNADGVAIGNSAVPASGTALFVAGEGATSGTKSFRTENSTGGSFFEYNDAGHVLQQSNSAGLGNYYRMNNTAAGGWSYFEFQQAGVKKGELKWYNAGTGFTGSHFGIVNHGLGMYFATPAATYFKWAIGAQSDGNTRMKLLTDGLIVAESAGTLSPLARIHSKASTLESAFRADYISGTARMEFTNAGRLEIDAVAGQDNFINLKSGGSTNYNGFLFYDGATNTGAISSWSSGGAAFLANNIYFNSVAGNQVHQAASYYKWALGAANDAGTNMKLDSVGLLLDDGIGASTSTAILDLGAGTTAKPSLRLRTGVAPTVPNDGDVWFDGSVLNIRISGVTRTVNVT